MLSSLDHRIRALLNHGVARAEWLAMGSWVVVYAFTRSHMSFLMALIPLLVMLAVYCVQTLTPSDRVWRFSGLVFILVFVASYKFLFMQFGLLYEAFSLPFAVITVLGASLLIRNTSDYVVTAVLTWVIVWPYANLDVPDARLYVLVFGFFSLALGWVNNHTYLCSLRNLLLLENQYRVMAETDFLTGIYNRRALMQRFEQVAASSPCGFFLMLDIDNFKRVNDQWGHDVGDQVLCTLARCMEAVDRRYCYGRLGGEEFGVVLDTSDQAQALDYVQRLMQTVRSVDTLPCRFTVSAGLVVFTQGSDVSEVLREADRHLYAAKKSGKDNVKYGPTLSSYLSSVI